MAANSQQHLQGLIAKAARLIPSQTPAHGDREGSSEDVRTPEEQDRLAALRDRAAESRDDRARLRDLADADHAAWEDVLTSARRDRASAAADRAEAADDRARAAADRQKAGAERAEAARHRTASAHDLTFATTDELTGAWTQRFGLEEASRELERACRTGVAFILAVVDVDGLKQVNDSHGHLAGDGLLRLVGATIRANVRSYDVIVRWGGDEFVCAMPDIGAPEARVRFQRIARVLTVANADHSVTFGLAEAGAGDSLQAVIARADAELLEARRLDPRRASPPPFVTGQAYSSMPVGVGQLRPQPDAAR